jgi:hypothetical protein
MEDFEPLDGIVPVVNAEQHNDLEQQQQQVGMSSAAPTAAQCVHG